MVPNPVDQQYETKQNLQRSEKDKFSGPEIREDESEGTLCGLPLIKELMDTGIILIPFAINAFGYLGPVAWKLLYAKDHEITAYHNRDISDIKQACQDANWSKHDPSAILDKSASGW